MDDYEPIEGVTLPTDLPAGWRVTFDCGTVRRDVDFRCRVNNTHYDLAAWVICTDYEDYEQRSRNERRLPEVMFAHGYPLDDITPFPGTAQEAVDYVANLIRMGLLGSRL